MSEIHTITRATIGTTLALSLGMLANPALADGELALQNVTIDANRQLVVRFSPGGAPKSPRITELKTPNHQVYIDFADATLDERTVPAGDQLTKNLSAKLPGLRRAAVGIVSNASTPTVRVVLTLDPDLPLSPRLAGVQEGAAIISLGGDLASAGRGANDGGVDEIKPFVMSDDTSETESAPAAASNDSSAAYEEYYRKFLQQKQLNSTAVPAGDWGPRKGTAAEADSVKKKGMRIIGTPLDSPALADLPESTKEAAYPPIGGRTAPRPKAKPVEELAPEPAPAAEPEAVVETTPVRGSHAPKPGAEAAEAPVAQPEAVAETQPEAAPEAAATDNGAAETPAVAAQPEATPAEEPAAEAEVEPVKAAPAPVRHQVANPRTAPAAPAARPVRKIAQAPAPAAAEEEPAAPEAAEGEAPAAESGEETNAVKAKKVFNSAVKNHMQGRVEQAVAQYKQALKLNPDLGCAHGNLGLAYNQMHNYENAISEFHKALAVNPRDAITYNGMGAALRAEKDMQGAIKNWQTAVKLDPKLAVAHFNLGTAFELENEPEQAMASYQAAVGVDPRFGEAYYRMGLIMQKRKRFQDAKANFKKALTISADSDYAADAKLKIAAIDKISK